jgi:ankyrin repeat protein
MFLDSGADITLTTQNGNNCLFWAACYEQVEVVKLLLEHPKRDFIVNAKNIQGDTGNNLVIVYCTKQQHFLKRENQNNFVQYFGF